MFWLKIPPNCCKSRQAKLISMKRRLFLLQNFPTFGISARNIFNHVNERTPVGVISSRIFGQANSLAGGPFGSQASNRRLDLQITFSFQSAQLSCQSRSFSFALRSDFVSGEVAKTLCCGSGMGVAPMRASHSAWFSSAQS